MELYVKVCRVSLIMVLIASSLGRFAAALARGGLGAALKDAFSFGMLITLAFGLVLCMAWAAISAFQSPGRRK